MVHIFLSGPGGAGKTTLSSELRRLPKFKTYKTISEVARKILSGRNLGKDHLRRVETFLWLQREVVRAQRREEERLEKVPGFVSDRSVVDSLAYVLWREYGDSEAGDRYLEEILREFKVSSTIFPA